MKVHWTNTAVEHLVAIFEYISRDSSQYALRVVDRITGRSEQIGLYPESGRMVPEYDAADVREVYESPYRIIYRVKSQQIDVLAVVHGNRILPPEL